MTVWIQGIALVAATIAALAFVVFVARTLWMLLSGAAERRERERIARENLKLQSK